MKEFNGNVLFLDRADINTDEIIPAKYLTEIEKTALKPHLLEDLTLEGFDVEKDLNEKAVIVTRRNFGCGSSREHAPWALEVNGVNVVIAPSFARIFRQNMYNCGMLAVELAEDVIDGLFSRFGKRETHASVDVDNATITLRSEGDTETIGFEISEFDKAVVQTGGWVEFADKAY